MMYNVVFKSGTMLKVDLDVETDLNQLEDALLRKHLFLSDLVGLRGEDIAGYAPDYDYENAAE